MTIDTILIVIGIIVSGIISGIAILYSTKQHNENATLNAFESITALIDTEAALFYRRIIYSAKDWSYLIEQFNKCFSKPPIWDLEFKKNRICFFRVKRNT